MGNIEDNPNFHNIQACSQIREEIWNLIERYADESDLTYWMMIGVLEKVKLEVVDAMNESMREGVEEEDADDEGEEWKKN